MANETQLHIFFFPFLAPGHMIPTVDMAKLFAMKGCKSTIITTPYYEPSFCKSIEETQKLGYDISVSTVNLPLEEVGLPESCQSFQSIYSAEMRRTFLKAIRMLDGPLERLIREKNPDCLVSDVLLHWTPEVATKCGIPTLVFHGTSFFSLCASNSMRLYEPYKNVTSDSELFVIPNFPGDITITRMQVPDFAMEENGSAQFFEKVRESVTRSYGVVVNSFCELEPAYANHYKNVLRIKSWHIGPVSLCNEGIQEKALRGSSSICSSSNNASPIDHHYCLKWLNAKQASSVIYICFGSMTNFDGAQLHEIARGLEASEQQFIWVVNKDPGVDEGKEEWLPEGYEKRMEGRGLILRGWAPQVLILEHEAIGGFVSHCGWNSTLEAVSSGVPMVTWPVSAEQFYNEKLVTQILKTGIAVGAKRWVRLHGDFINRELVEKGVKRIMVGGEAEEMRRRAKGYADLAKRAVEEGGSSFSDLKKLLEELRSCRIISEVATHHNLSLAQSNEAS